MKLVKTGCISNEQVTDILYDHVIDEGVDQVQSERILVPKHEYKQRQPFLLLIG